MWLLGRAWSTPAGFIRGAQFVFRTIGGLVRGKTLVGLGGALAAHFANATLVKKNVPLLLNTPAIGLETEGDRVVGVRVKENGRERVIYANKGVMLGAGGPESNQEWRKKYQNVTGYTSGNPGNLGPPNRVLTRDLCRRRYIDDAWWGGWLAPFDDGPAGGFLVGGASATIHDDRGRAGQALCGTKCEIFIDLGHHIDDHDRGGDFWMITSSPYNKHYFRTFSIQPGLMKGMEEKGLKHSAKNIDELAGKIGVPAANLRETADRISGFARTGIDQDFHKGDSAYDRYYGDPTVGPNPCLGPMDKGPYNAYKIVAGDLGTKGGLVTDVDSRVLREDGTVIEGLYAAGNTTATVMGHTYPGPGSTIGPASVFGLRGARHMAKS